MSSVDAVTVSLLRAKACFGDPARSAAPQTGPAPASRPAREVEQQAANDGEAFQELPVLPRPEHHTDPGVAVREPERDGGKPISTRAVQRGHKPMIRASGPGYRAPIHQTRRRATSWGPANSGRPLRLVRTWRGFRLAQL